MRSVTTAQKYSRALGNSLPTPFAPVALHDKDIDIIAFSPSS
jgi:hypothetical protein